MKSVENNSRTAFINCKKTDDKIRQRIILCAQEYFFHNGYKKTKIESITKELHISKKSFYCQFQSKDELLSIILLQLKEKFINRIQSLSESKIPFFDKLVSLLYTIAEYEFSINNRLFDDLRKYFPGLFDSFVTEIKLLIMKHFHNCIDEGKKLGLIRKDIDNDILMLLFMSACRTFKDKVSLIDFQISKKDELNILIQLFLKGMFAKLHTESNKDIFDTNLKHNSI